MRRERVDLLFAVFLLAFVAWATFEARGWDLRARLFPWAVGLPVLALLIVYVAMAARSALRPAPVRAPSSSAEEEDVDPVAARNRGVAIVAWMVGFAIVIWALGFAIGGTLATLAYLKTAARERWPISLAITGGTGLFFWLMLTFLHVPFPRGFVIDQLPF